MLAHAISRFLRSHFRCGPKRVRILRDRRVIIQVAGLHCSFGGKLPKAYRGRFNVMAFQLALNSSHSKVFEQTKQVINMKIELIIVLNKFRNKVFLSF